MNRGANVQLTSKALSLNESYVIAANHQSRIDPFIICSQLPLSTWRYLSPFRFFAYNRLFDNIILHWILVGFGCFPTKPHASYEHGLSFAIKALSEHQSIFIFPEGKRSVQGASARPGVAELSQLRNVKIIPVHIEWQGRNWWRSYKIAVGIPFTASQMTPDEIMATIYRLPV